MLWGARLWTRPDWVSDGRLIVSRRLGYAPVRAQPGLAAAEVCSAGRGWRCKRSRSC